MDRETERGIEWECERVIRQFYHLTDHYEFDEAVKLFTEDVVWKVAGLDLKGREQLLDALHGGIGNDTIRHVITNTIVTVIDEDNADLLNYTNIYYSREGRRDEMDGPLHFEGPHRFADGVATMRRVGDEWQIAAREGGQLIFSARTNRWPSMIGLGRRARRNCNCIRRRNWEENHG